jgi:hypothetical protein
MSATPDGDDARVAATPSRDLSADEESRYFRAIEAVFVRLRGAPLLLSPEDYRVAARWRREGVPLRLVESTLEEIFARRRDRGTKGRINSLRYCAPAVDAAWAEVQALTGPARREPAAVDGDAVAARLAELADTLPPSLPGRDALAARIEALSGDPESVERGLRALDDELVATADSALEAAERERIDAEVEGILAGLRERFPEDELASLRVQLRRQRLRRLVGLPVLTLF